MRKTILSSMLLAIVLISALITNAQAYPARPGAARVQYELYYFPVRVVNSITAIMWDVPTASFQDAIRGQVGGTKMVARNLGKEDGSYELIAGNLTGGPVGLVGGSVYGVFHGFTYGAKNGFMGYPAEHDSGSHTVLFRSKQYIVPYDDNY